MSNDNDPPFCGVDEARRLNAEYEEARRQDREEHPVAERQREKSRS